MEMVDLIAPVLQKIKTSAPQYQLRYWGNETKIEQNMVSYRLDITENPDYNSDAYDVELTIDIWAKYLDELLTNSHIIVDNLKWFNDVFTIDGRDYTLVVFKMKIEDFGRDEPSNLWRKHIKVPITIIFED